MDHELVRRGDEVAAVGDVFLAGADDLGRLDVEAEGEAGDRAVVGYRDLAAERLEGAGVDQVGEVALDPRLVGEVGVDAGVEVPLVRQPDEEHRRDDCGEDLPAPAPGVAGLEQAPAEQADGDEDRQDRGGEHRVAGEDREAGAGEQREGAEGERSGGDAEDGAAAQEGETEGDAAEGADHPRPLQHLAEAAGAVEDEVDGAGLPFQGLDRFFGAGPGVSGAAGRDPVEERPEQGSRPGPAGRGGDPRSDKRRPNEAGTLSIRPLEGVVLPATIRRSASQ